jgi:hypothetical protein
MYLVRPLGRRVRRTHRSWNAVRSRSTMPASSRSSLRLRAWRSSSFASTSAAAITRTCAALVRWPGATAPSESDGPPSPMRIARAASTERLPAVTAAPISRNQGSELEEALLAAESRATVPTCTRAAAFNAVDPVSCCLRASGVRTPPAAQTTGSYQKGRRRVSMRS